MSNGKNGHGLLLKRPLFGSPEEVWVALDERRQDGEIDWPSRSQVVALLNEADHINWPPRSLVTVHEEVIFAPEEPAAKERFQVLRDVDLIALPEPSWLVEGILPAGGFSLLWGQYGTGKSFVALDLAMCVAAGRPWHGHAVERGPVAYVVAEGTGRFGRRVSAWREAHGVTEPADAWFIPAPVNLLKREDMQAFLTALGGSLPAHPSLVVFDTFSRCIPGGDENKQETMSAVVSMVGGFQRATQAHVLLVHHPGWAVARPRGSTVLAQAVDTIFGLHADMKLTCDKQKDAEPLADMYLALEPFADSRIVKVRASNVFDIDQAVLQYVKANPGQGTTQIRDSDGLKSSRPANVASALRRLQLEQLIENRGRGRRTAWFPGALMNLEMGD